MIGTSLKSESEWAFKRRISKLSPQALAIASAVVKGGDAYIHYDLVLFLALVDLFPYSPHHLLNLSTDF
jgi:hypothetical protein